MAQDGRHRMGEDIKVITRMLQRPIRRQLQAARQFAVHHPVRIIEDGFRHFGAIARVNQYRSS